ncbi:MAG: hypothetical protein Q4G14_08110 [Paracoccus sp. (in: a-proteobacteria)]|uniref:hypothetical protein n=1 Tax=Paracoccus sp. TaxID=267 RepID=UPI0026E0C3E7|nr:hypothetical protein [Paracoccus sp. (in: a-proteobacteria)]MDO5613190.1 hypothetical protein [Paracoccus sp. (in: a-proteobacteria)]
MKPGLTVGSVHRHSLAVGEGQLVPALFGGTAFSDMPAVFAADKLAVKRAAAGLGA